MLTRSYGDVDGRFKDGGSVLLMKGEQPRAPYPWRKYSACPQCGSKGLWEQNDTCGHCLKCSTWIWRDPPAPWSKSHESAAQAGKTSLLLPREYICEHCLEIFMSRSKNPDAVKYCPDCRPRVKKARDKGRRR